MKKILLLVGILVLVFIGRIGRAEEPIKKLEGWGEYKFGMSISQTTAVRKDARWEEMHWGKPPEKEQCLVQDSEFYGEKGRIIVRFKKARLAKIHIEFRRLEGGCDEKLLRTVYDPLVKLYSLKYAKVEGREIVWRFPQGGMITLLNICITKNDTDFKPEAIGTGMVSVIYEHSEGF